MARACHPGSEGSLSVLQHSSISAGEVLSSGPQEGLCPEQTLNDSTVSHSNPSSTPYPCTPQAQLRAPVLPPGLCGPAPHSGAAVHTLERALQVLRLHSPHRQGGGCRHGAGCACQGHWAARAAAAEEEKTGAWQLVLQRRGAAEVEREGGGQGGKGGEGERGAGDGW